MVHVIHAKAKPKTRVGYRLLRLTLEVDFERGLSLNSDRAGAGVVQNLISVNDYRVVDAVLLNSRYYVNRSA